MIRPQHRLQITNRINNNGQIHHHRILLNSQPTIPIKIAFSIWMEMAMVMVMVIVYRSVVVMHLSWNSYVSELEICILIDCKNSVWSWFSLFHGFWLFIGKVSEWKCSNGTCIPLSRYCNGIPDCSDKSDEPSACSGEYSTIQVLSIHFKQSIWQFHSSLLYPKAFSFQLSLSIRCFAVDIFRIRREMRNQTMYNNC